MPFRERPPLTKAEAREASELLHAQYKAYLDEGFAKGMNEAFGHVAAMIDIIVKMAEALNERVDAAEVARAESDAKQQALMDAIRARKERAAS